MAGYQFDQGCQGTGGQLCRHLSRYHPLQKQGESTGIPGLSIGLPNRLLPKDRQEQNLVSAKRLQHKTAILFLDLDGLKAVNDLKGHRVGDLLLQEAARRFNACIREEDTLGRLGGDEFLICIQKIEHQHEIQLIASRLISALVAHELRIDGEYCKVGVSIIALNGNLNWQSRCRNSHARPWFVH